MIFSKQLRLVREKLLLSQEMMARELGVSFATISRLENNHTEPSLATRRSFIEFCERENIILANFEMEGKPE